MASNKFATMVHKNTNKITLVLIYALLEWTLIILLLLNSIFSYFIFQFAWFFGLKPPCILCTRVDRFFEPDTKNSYRDVLCEFHCRKIVDLIGSDLVSGDFERKHEVQKQGMETEEAEIESRKKEDSNSEKLNQDLEFFLDYSGNQLVPVESIDPITENFVNNLEIDEDQEFGDFQEAEVILESKIETFTEEMLKKNQETEKTETLSKFVELDSMEFEETENSLVFHVNSNGYPVENPTIYEPTQNLSDNNEIQETEGVDSEHEEAEVSIGTEIPVLDSCDEIKAQDNFKLYSLSHEEPSTSSHDLDFNLEYEAQKDGKTEELNLNQLENTLLMIERKESMVDESLDGSEMENGEASNTIEKLKSALKAERKVLRALYTELEEERSASAVAASETMAMINRLQEEKAAMQMEALHYQRMMEEQSEYDQEALQLLNELMVKKDKELELYRKKVLEYEDGNGIWVDLNHEPKEDGILDGSQESQNQNSPVDATLNLDSSFGDYEDERLSILEQLKVLEEKLVTLSEEEDQHLGELRQIEDYFEENGKHLNWDYGHDGQEVNGITNGFPNVSHEVHYQDRRTNDSTGKRHFPRFEALETESDDSVIMSNGHGNGFHPDKVENTAITIFELQKRRIDIEEEVEQLYVRLQALEADREFLKHCVGSLKKGDKGMKLLQEILQHLRDLRNIDLRAKSSTDGTLV